MQKYDVDIPKLKENARNIIQLSNELNSIFSNIFDDLESVSIKNIWLGNSALDFVKKAKLEREQYIKLKDTIYEEGKLIYDYAAEIERRMRYFDENPLTVHYDILHMKNYIFPSMDNIKNEMSSVINYIDRISVPSNFSASKSLNNIFQSINNTFGSVIRIEKDLIKFDYSVRRLSNDFELNIKGASISDMVYRDMMIKNG